MDASEHNTYRLVKVTISQEARRLPKCDHCGHDIRVLCVLEHAETGEHITVGSDCVRQFVSTRAAQTAEQVARRYERAARQWRSKTPVARDGETREQYIMRRVDEMGHALAAAHEWLRWSASPLYRRAGIINERARRMFGIPSRWPDYWTPFGGDVIQERALARIERKHRANRFDFCRALWDVKKL